MLSQKDDGLALIPAKCSLRSAMALVIYGLNPHAGCHILDKIGVNIKDDPAWLRPPNRRNLFHALQLFHIQRDQTGCEADCHRGI